VNDWLIKRDNISKDTGAPPKRVVSVFRQKAPVDKKLQVAGDGRNSVEKVKS
jgi:hypothetical protein